MTSIESTRFPNAIKLEQIAGHGCIVTEKIYWRSELGDLRILRAFSALALSVGLVHGQQPASQDRTAAADQVIDFDVATVKPSPAKMRSWKMEFTLDGFTAQGVTVKEVVQEAYDAYEAGRIAGGPAWLDADRFDIEAKTDSDAAGDLRKLSLAQRRAALQRFLAERFKLSVHHENRELSVFALYPAPKGVKLQPTASRKNPGKNDIEGYEGLVKRSNRGLLEVEDISVLGLAQLLANDLHKPVVDSTNIQGRFDFTLHWTPDDAVLPGFNKPGSEAIDTTWPSLPAALREELGLDIKPEKRLIECIVIDNATMPSEN